MQGGRGREGETLSIHMPASGGVSLVTSLPGNIHFYLHVSVSILLCSLLYCCDSTGMPSFMIAVNLRVPLSADGRYCFFGHNCVHTWTVACLAYGALYLHCCLGMSNLFEWESFSPVSAGLCLGTALWYHGWVPWPGSKQTSTCFPCPIPFLPFLFLSSSFLSSCLLKTLANQRNKSF